MLRKQSPRELCADAQRLAQLNQVFAVRRRRLRCRRRRRRHGDPAADQRPKQASGQPGVERGAGASKQVTDALVVRWPRRAVRRQLGERRGDAPGIRRHVPPALAPDLRRQRLQRHLLDLAVRVGEQIERAPQHAREVGRTAAVRAGEERRREARHGAHQRAPVVVEREEARQRVVEFAGLAERARHRGQSEDGRLDARPVGVGVVAETLLEDRTEDGDGLRAERPAESLEGERSVVTQVTGVWVGVWVGLRAK